MNYDLVLFDLDDTLLDFGRARDHALAQVLVRFAPHATHAELTTRFHAINLHLWQELEQGRATKDEVLIGRFTRLFGEFEVAAEAAQANDHFLDMLSTDAFLLHGAVELVSFLRTRVTLGIVSNGHGPTQRKRLDRAGLADAFAFALISDEVGAAKPHPLIFQRALEAALLAPGARVLMIGDNLEADIGGARAAGFDTCWVSARPLPAGTPEPTFVAKNLAEVQAWVSI